MQCCCAAHASSQHLNHVQNPSAEEVFKNLFSNAMKLVSVWQLNINWNKGPREPILHQPIFDTLLEDQYLEKHIYIYKQSWKMFDKNNWCQVVSDSRATHLCHLATLTCKSSFCCKKTEMEDLKSCLARDDHGWQSWFSFYLLSRIPNSCSCPCSVLHKKRHMAISQEPWYIIDPLLSKRPRKKDKVPFSKKCPLFKKGTHFQKMPYFHWAWP